MPVISIAQLLEKFGPGDAPRSDDYIDLIDTLADDRNAVYFDSVEPTDTAANPLWFNTSTNELSVYSGGQWNTVQGSGGSSTNISATSPLSYNFETGELSIDLSTYDTSSEVDAKLTNYYTSSQVDTELSNYDISSEVDAKLSNYDTSAEVDTKLSDYDTSVQVDTKLSDYYTSSQVDTELLNYDTSSEVDTKLSNYDTSSEIDAKLSNYDTSAEVDTKLSNYDTSSELDTKLSSYDTSSEVDAKLGDYDTSSEVDNKVSAAISNLVDTAPATLDTLNELAAALGDDPNFATTVTNQIAGKADITGASFSGNVTINNSAFTIDSLGGTVPNFVMQGDGEQTFQFYNTAATGSTRVSWKMANRVNDDWTWILYTDKPDNGTQDLVFQNRNGESLYLGEGNQVKGNFVSQPVEKSSSFSITNSDAGKTIVSTANAMTITVTDVLLPGDRVDFVQQGPGQINFVGSGITLNAADGRSKTRTQYSVASVVCISAGIYVLGGDIS